MTTLGKIPIKLKKNSLEYFSESVNKKHSSDKKGAMGELSSPKKNSLEYFSESVNKKHSSDKKGEPGSPREIKEVAGLYYCPNFLTSEESKILIDDLKKNDQWVGVSSNKNSRRVIHYGYIYSYTGGPLTPTDPIPGVYKSIIERFQALIKNIFGDPVPIFDQLIINEYLPGQGISAHTDHITKFGSIIVCITLGTGVEMEFTKQGKSPTQLYVEPCSLYIMSGDARYLWKHAISQRKNDLVKGINVPRGTRISLTFRTAQTGGHAHHS